MRDKFKKCHMRRTKNSTTKPTKRERKVVTKIVKSITARTSELKYRDTLIPLTFIDGKTTNPLVYFASTIVDQGDTDSDRIGDQLTLTSCTARFFIELNKAAATGNESVNFRMICFQWHPVTDVTVGTIGATLPLSLVLLNGSDGTTITPDSQYNIDRRSQFTILVDRTLTIFNYSNVASTHRSFVIRVPLKKAQKKVQYVNADDTVGSNHLIWVVISQNLSSLASPPTFSGTTRIRYRDS